MKPSMKRSIKYGALKLGWFVATFATTSVLWSKFPFLSWEGLGILFLGGSAYVLGMEVIDRHEKTIKIV